MRERRGKQPGPNLRRAADAFARVVEIMRVLRSPAGCPWDIKQTHASLRPFLIEESYEALEAIDRNDLTALAGELGDVLLQCVFHAQLATETRTFDIVQVIDGLSEKLIRRHPHVFHPDGRPLSAASRRRLGIGTPEQVKEQWAALKAAEQRKAGQPARVLAGLPRALPALSRASKIGTRVASVGFDWPDADGVLDKIDEEVRELRRAIAEGPDALEDEMGDVLFSIANLARKLHIDPELALAKANDKFTRRFDMLEAHLQSQGKDVHAVPLTELESTWQLVKTTSARGPRSRSRRPTFSRASRRR
jgi:MazG family protein